MASIVVATVTIALKTLAWVITDSVGLLSDAMESLVNLASAVFGLVMVTIAARPADEDHPYGHHKAEYFSRASSSSPRRWASSGPPGTGCSTRNRSSRWAGAWHCRWRVPRSTGCWPG
jgi:hypothetical protein